MDVAAEKDRFGSYNSVYENDATAIARGDNGEMVMGDSYKQNKYHDVTAEAAQNGSHNSMEGVDATAIAMGITEKWSWVTATNITNIMM